MKDLSVLQKVAAVIGLSYGLWLGVHVDATNTDVKNAFVIVILTIIILLS